MIKESTLQKSRYLRALFSTLPFGVLALVFSFKSFINTPKVNDLNYVKSMVIDYKLDKFRFENLGNTTEAVYFSVEKYDKTLFTYIGSYKRRLLLIEPKHKVIEFWFAKNGEILQAKLNGSFVFEYQRIGYLMLGFALFGAFCVVVSLIYLIKSPEELYGGNKEKAKGFWDPWNKYMQSNRWRN